MLSERVTPEEQLVHYDADSPHVGLLGISKIVEELLWRCIEQRPALGKVLRTVGLDCEPKINQFHLSVLQHNVVRFHVAVDHVLLIVQVGETFEDSPYQLGALLFCQV